MDRALLLELYRRYSREIYLYLYSLCRNHELAEDLRQETFLKALLSLDGCHTNMRAWLYLVARNLYLNVLKQSRRVIPLEEIPKEQGVTEGEILEVLIQDEQRRMLYEALLSLPTRKREILVMQYWGRMRQKEIALVMGITPENVRVLSCRAKKELKKKLNHMEVEENDIP